MNNNNTYLNTSQDILQDFKANGKQRPWRFKKLHNVKIANSFGRLGYENKKVYLLQCSEVLAFERNIDAKLTLKSANFCKQRLCPMCQWRKSMKVFHEVGRVMDEVQRREPSLEPIFLTLTQRNCDYDDLINEVDRVFEGWKRLIDTQPFRNQVKGWFRALEVTFNHKKNTWHPHFHVILLVDKSYFSKDNKHYITAERWWKLWRTAMKLDYDPNIDIRKVKGNNTRKRVSEVAKYTLKDSHIVGDKDNPFTEEQIDRVVSMLAPALKRRRLYAYGGIMKVIAKELGAERPDEGDLVNIDEQTVRADLAEMVEIYEWNFGLGNYIRAR